jgi:hypothetical protein
MASQILDADLCSLTDDVMRLYPELSEIVRWGYTNKGSFYVAAGEWRKV